MSNPQAAHESVVFPPNALIISAATTGSWPTKAQNPNVPTTPEEIARAAVECGESGAAIVHIHVRDDDERVTCDPARYARVRELVEAAGSDVVVNMSTGGGAGTSSDEERLAPVALAPEIASFDCGSVNFGERVFINSPTFLRELAQRMNAHGVKPEIECFEPGHVWNALRLIDDGLLQPPLWFQFVLGVDVTSRTLVALIEPGSCFAGTLAELAFAADRAYMLIGSRQGDNRAAPKLALSAMNFGPYPMSHGLTRLESRFQADPSDLNNVRARQGEALDAETAEELGLVTFALDDIDWDDEVRVFFEARTSFSPDSLTGLEANLRFVGPETMESKIFARLTAWQNWIFQRPNAVGKAGALQRYGTGERPQFDMTRV